VREGKTSGFDVANSGENVAPVIEGCRLHGHLEVNKVAGNFHIAPGQSFQQHNVHVHSLRNIRLNMLNTTHLINELTFGEPFPAQVNPLSRTQQISHEGAILYHYYVKVVPSTYVFLNQTQLLTNQYSVTKHRKPIRNLFDSSDHQLPGTFFTYEISAIMVKFIEQKRSLAHFITSLCAIIVGLHRVS
jgi:endoplasmic reticulum-Golgi intermediate compartment protein 3